ncbi:MAG: DNA (cytosine-5-)-methyltransferase [Verrucomicrobia bacterium]|jgi:DNA (cytosine-5)-methyltransferase 1|nr:DNA (cytosine-5-)-methyltransferase [Verrucomicrobiota bacterium]
MNITRQQQLLPLFRKEVGDLYSREKPHKVVGLFSGIGGFELGLQHAEHETLLMCEIWEPAIAVLSKRFPGIPIVNDVSDLATDPSAIPRDASLLTAGFPCTDLSQAGMTAGINGENSGLVYQVFRILHQRVSQGDPVPWLLIENVPFMLQLKKGRAIDVIVTELEALGYRWAYRVVNSQAFGLPQRRERVFLIASLEGDPRDVLLSDDVGAPEKPSKVDWRECACGFYWTEGTRGLGWGQDCVPTIKGGSGIGIASPPAIVLPDGRIVKPNIRDVERLQGFGSNWTLPVEKEFKPGLRWKLVGNAVSVNVLRWLGKRFRRPRRYDPTGDTPLRLRGKAWPRAAWNVDGQRMVAAVSAWPERRRAPGLASFLKSEPTLLSARATRGFLSRATSDKCGLRFLPGFLDVVREHLKVVERMEQ